MQMLSKFTPGDVSDQADVGAGRLQRLVTVQGTKMTVVPSAAKQG